MPGLHDCVRLVVLFPFLLADSLILRLTPNNTAADEWETHCVDCAPLAIQAKLQSEGRTSSAKIRMILKLLHDIDERAEGEKTIIFSQFTSMLDLIEPFLRDRGIKYVRCETFRPLSSFPVYLILRADDGSMNTTEREFSLSKIKKSLQTHVILISFKAGSTGAFW
jgi:SNF2 family DNA or RNA helicase